MSSESIQVVAVCHKKEEAALTRGGLGPFRVYFCRDFEEGIEVATSHQASVLLLQEKDADPKMTPSRLSEVKRVLPETAVVLINGSQKLETLSVLVNQGACFRILPPRFNESDLSQAVSAGIEYSGELKNQRKVLKEISRKNRELERLTRDLEKIVAERTYHIEISKQEIEHKIAKMRHLLRFIKDVDGQRTIDDLVRLIRKEVRRFHKVGDPLTLYQNESKGVFLLFFRQSQITERNLTDGHPFGEGSLEPQDDRIFLANHLGRPIAQIITIPILANTVRIYIEHSMSDDEVLDFMSFVDERIQPIRIAFERLLFDEQVTTASYRWEKTFDGIRDPICIVNSERELVLSNQAFDLAFSKTHGSHDFPNEAEDPVYQAFESGEPSFGALAYQGEIYEVHSYPIRISKERKVVSAVNYYTNVTAERRLYSRMIQNEKMGAIGLLAGNIAHELNNPLTGIGNLAQTLQREAVEDNLKQDLAEIEKAAQRSQRVIRDLLDFSTGRGSLELVSLDKVVEKTFPMLKTALKQHRLFLELGTSEYQVRVEPNLLQQVVFNLINNACQAMVEVGELRVTTSFVEWAGQPSLRLSVCDTGPGIPKSHIEKVFEPFFTTKSEGTGTGLGLSMSKSIVTKFDGSIELESSDGQGSCFHVILPVHGGCV